VAKICAASYSIYLLHPFALRTVQLAAPNLESHDLGATLFLSAAITIAASLLAYKFLEMPFIGLGKKLTHKLPSDTLAQPSAASRM
jgi:peptidoglycan/LPS O-acetylase OafA/YrhL